MPLPKTLSTTPDLALTSQWTAAHVAAIADTLVAHIPVITASDARAIVPGVDLWDSWPLQLENGANAVVAGGALWFMLSAPALPDPNDRHGQARIRLLLERDGAWIDCGNALPDGLSPGSREWAGSALYEPASGKVTLYFTAAGYRGEAPQSFAQRLFETVGQLDLSGETPRISHWSAPTESVAADGLDYVIGQPDGMAHPASSKASATPPISAIRQMVKPICCLPDHWHAQIMPLTAASALPGAMETVGQLLPPLVEADGLNNELERPHMISARWALFSSSGPPNAACLRQTRPMAPTAFTAWSPIACLAPIARSTAQDWWRLIRRKNRCKAIAGG